VPHGKTVSSPYRVQVLDRALSILGLLGERPGDRSLAEVCVGLKLHKSTCHRLLTVLEQNRFVEKSPNSGRYRLGLRLFELGSKAMASLDLREQSRPHLSMVSSRNRRDRALLSFRSGRGALHRKNGTAAQCAYVLQHWPPCSRVLHRRRESYSFRTSSVGSGCDCQPLELKEITKNTITTPEALFAELKMIRERGFAVDDEEETKLVCVAWARPCTIIWEGRSLRSVSPVRHFA